MYHYSTLKQDTANKSYIEPTDNMLINGTPLNQLVPGYRHLTVAGRGLIGRSIQTTAVPGRRGVWVDGFEDMERTLEIKYQIQAPTSGVMRERFAKLNEVLRTHAESGFLEISFRDEPDYVYYAIFSEADDIEEKSLMFTSKFSLLVPDGYKKKTAQQSTGKINLRGALEVLPESVTVTISKTTNKVQIINGSKILSFAGAYSQGKDLTVAWGQDEITAVYNGRSILSELERFSPLETFTVKHNDTITAKDATVKNVVWRDERL